MARSDSRPSDSGAAFYFASVGVGAFISKVMTTFTHHKDYWHLCIQGILNDGEQPDNLLFHFEGPAMSELDNPIWHEWNAGFGFKISSFYYERLAKVYLDSYC